MKCTDCRDSVHSYLGDELEERLRAEVESHLAECADCGCEVTDWHACLTWLRRAFPEQGPPRHLWEEILARTTEQTEQ